MQTYAFAPVGFDEDTNLDVLLFVPNDAPDWSENQPGAGHVCIERTTGEHYAYVPYGTMTLPAFTPEDLQCMKSAQEDLIAGVA